MPVSGIAVAEHARWGRRFCLLMLVLSILSALWGARSSATAATERDNGATDRYVVLLKDSVDHPGALARAQVDKGGGRLGFVYRHAFKGYSAVLPKAALAGLRADPRVELVAPDEEVEAFGQATPTGISRTFAAGNEKIDIDGADDARVDVDIAVIDTGVDYTHPDLEVVARTDCSNGTEKEATCANESGTDLVGHGTHVAGTAAAIDNGKGVVGVAPGARIWAVKVLNPAGFDSEIAAGVDWVTARSSEIEVANMSLGGAGENPATAAAISGSVDKGIVYVVAAGNSGDNVSGFSPANHPDVITVSALADFDGLSGGKAGSTYCRAEFDIGSETSEGDDKLAWFSNWGTGVEVAAPGVCIRSTVPGGGYAEVGWAGTSMASPHVAGAAAIRASMSNPSTQADVEAIRKTIVEEGNSGWEDTSGDGVKEPLLDLSDKAVFAPSWQGEGGAAPSATTNAATEVGSSIAILQGTVHPQKSKTTYQFEYGTTTAYGSKSPASAAIAGMGNKNVDVSQPTSGLAPETTYHYRIVATNAKGTSNGADKTFTTGAVQGWSVETSPNPSEAEGSAQSLTDVDCPGEGWCMAIGGYSNSGGSGPLAATWNGTAWSAVSTTAGTALNDVACEFITICLGIGSKEGKARLERWTKMPEGWKAITLPSIEGTSSVLNGGACWGPWSEWECVVVGSNTVSGEERPLVLRYGEDFFGNVLWQVQAAPKRGEDSALNAVSCIDGTSCVAVGYSVEGGDKHPLALHWNDYAWVGSFPPDSEGESTYLNDVSCTGSSSSTTCHAVGATEGGISKAAVGMRFAYEEWTEQLVGDPSGGASTSLDSVSCSASGACAAAGSATVSSKAAPLAVTWSELGWTPEPVVDPSNGKGASFGGISCESTSACLAVGSYTGAKATLTLAERRKPFEPKAPTATTNAATGVAEKGATLNATVNPNGAETTYQFEYGPTTSYGTKVPASPKAIGSGTSNVAVNEAISGLSANTTYHFRVVATNSKGTTNGADQAFTTAKEEPKAPTATTNAATGVAEKGATLNATVNPNGAETTYQFEYGTTTSYGTKVPASPKAIGSGTSNVAVSEAISGLSANTTYHFRVVATNSKGTTNGADQAFTTAKEEPKAPTATTNAATGVAEKGATLNATVNPNGAETTYQFEYGPTTSYGTKVPASPKAIGSGTSNVAVNEAISGLSANTTYHFRVVATNSKGTTNGADQAFTTQKTAEWKIESTPNPSSASGSAQILGKVSCYSDSWCMASGFYSNSETFLGVLVELWDGTSWSIVTPPAYPPKDVYCLSGTECFAVGSKSGKVGADSWTKAGGWKTMTPPTVEGTSSVLHSMTCSPFKSKFDCVAVGSHTVSGEERPLAMRWDTQTQKWTLHTTPTKGEDSMLTGISCNEVGSCIAVGYYVEGGNKHPLAMHWNGTTWSLKTVPDVEGEGKDTQLSDVSCAGEAGSSTRCVAVGVNEGTVKVPVTKRWNGSEWIEAAPKQPAEAEGEVTLPGVSCVSTTECFAVGSYVSAAGGSEAKTLVQQWNGSEWSIATSPNREGHALNNLFGVSCGPSFKCLAVGSSKNASLNRTDTLAMRRQ